MRVHAEFRNVAQLHSLLLTLEADSHVAEVLRYRPSGVEADVSAATETAL